MEIIDLPVEQLHEAAWNANHMDEPTMSRLTESLSRYGLVSPLVVRKTGTETFEVLSGNQRLKAIREMGYPAAPCVVVDLNDAQAMLLAQALNGIHGEDDLALKAELVRQVLAEIPESEILSLLPETAESLRALSSMSETDMAAHLQAWQEAQAARLKHMQLQFTPRQLETVEEALARITPKAKEETGNPNTRGSAIYLLCRFYLERMKEE